jgi:hypothetical protein
MKHLIFIALCIAMFTSCAAIPRTQDGLHPTDNRVIINTGYYAKHGHIVMFDDDGDRTPDYFEYYDCLWGEGDRLTVKQPDGSYRFGDHRCIKRGFADFRPKSQ